MRFDAISSGALEGAAYDPETRTLVVRFESGGTYEYYDVDETLYDELVRPEPHPWRRVGQRIKEHRFRRLD
jgi:hypothetical protein